MSPVDPAQREAFLERQAEKYGDGTIVDKDVVNGRIPFKSPMMTWATTGGIPIGHVYRPWGPEGSGKSLSNLGLIWAAERFPEIVSVTYENEIKFLEKRGAKSKLAIVRKKKELKELVARFPDGMDTIVFDTEGRFERPLARRLGINMKRLEIIDDTIIEQICDSAAEACSAFHLLIIDSTAQAQSLAEAELVPGNELRASGPRAWSRLKQIRQAMDPTMNTLVLVDQVRTQLGKVNFKGQAAVEPPNVRIIKHAGSVTVEFNKGSKLYLNSDGLLTDDYKRASDDFKALGTNGKEPHGLEMRCYVEKNSTGRPYRNARMRFKFPVADVRSGELIQEAGFDMSFELLEIGVYFHIVEDAGQGRFFVLDEKFNRTKQTWRGEWRARAAIMADDELRERIMQRLARDTLV